MRWVALLALCGCLDIAETPDAAPADAASDTFADPVARGALALVHHACVDCHQSTNAADGELSGVATALPASNSYPANLTPDDETGLGKWSNADIVRALRFGIDQVSDAPHWVPLCPQMPHFYAAVGPDEANDIALFLKSLPPVHHQIPRSVCPPYKFPLDAGAD